MISGLVVNTGFIGSNPIIGLTKESGVAIGLGRKMHCEEETHIPFKFLKKPSLQMHPLTQLDSHVISTLKFVQSFWQWLLPHWEYISLGRVHFPPVAEVVENPMIFYLIFFKYSLLMDVNRYGFNERRRFHVYFFFINNIYIAFGRDEKSSIDLHYLKLRRSTYINYSHIKIYDKKSEQICRIIIF